MSVNPTPLSLLAKHPAHWISLGLGSGLLPLAPGTWGTLLAVFFFYWLVGWSLLNYLILLTVLLGLAVLSAGFTSMELGEHDHPAIVIDEIVAMLIVLIPLLGSWHWGWVALAFALFRVFDILKPPPIALLDRRIRGGFGIVLDDIVAAFYALLVLQASMLLYS